MSLHTRVVTVACVLAIPLTIAGCAASPDEAELTRLEPGPPLAHDPTDKFEIGPWWSDGTHLLNLRSDGGYSVYRDNNRYSQPIDRGRWGQQNYGTLWLLPYGGDQPQRIRVAITRIDGRIALQPPTLGDMFALPGPPKVAEDALLGRWQGAMGALSLNPDSTYQFSPAPGAVTDKGEVIAGHNGRWTLSGESITLAPTTPSVQPSPLKVRTPAVPDAAAPAAPSEPVLEGLGGELIKVKAQKS